MFHAVVGILKKERSAILAKLLEANPELLPA